MVATYRPDRPVVTVRGCLVDPSVRYDPENGHPGYEFDGPEIRISPDAVSRLPRPGWRERREPSAAGGRA